VPTELPVIERPELSQVKGTYAFVSLGCPKNLVDSERMLGLLQLDGYRLVAEPAGADFVVVNTCGFIENAREESFASIDAMLDLKRSGQTRGVIVSWEINKNSAPCFSLHHCARCRTRIVIE